MIRQLIIYTLLVYAAFAAAPAFDVASVKLNKSGDDHSSTNVSVDKDAVKLTMQNDSLFYCIQRAFGVKDYQVSGPEWLKSEKYDIVGTKNGVPKDQVLPMLQTLLADRFQLKLHRETKVLPIYKLVVAKGGFKITRVEPEGQSGTWQANGRLTAKNESLALFADVLSRQLDRPVVDKTGIGGVFNFVLEYSKDDGGETPTAPSIFTALQEKLGLKLEAGKGPVEVLVIDSAERVPTEN